MAIEQHAKKLEQDAVFGIQTTLLAILFQNVSEFESEISGSSHKTRVNMHFAVTMP